MAILTLKQYEADVAEYNIDISTRVTDIDLAFFDITPIALCYYLDYGCIGLSKAKCDIYELIKELEGALESLEYTLSYISKREQLLDFVFSDSKDSAKSAKNTFKKLSWHGTSLDFKKKRVECLMNIIESRERVELKNKQNNN